jgi:hypothetical protein
MIPDSQDSENVQSADDFANEVNAAKDALLADSEAEISNASPIYDGAISSLVLKEAIPSFDINNSEEVQIYEEE